MTCQECGRKDETCRCYHFDTRVSLRDQFAMAALTGLLAGQTEVACEALAHAEKAAAWSYEYADAMMKAREQK